MGSNPTPSAGRCFAVQGVTASPTDRRSDQGERPAGAKACQAVPGSVTPAVTPGYSRPVATIWRRARSGRGASGFGRRRVVHGVRQGGERRGLALPRSRRRLAGDLSRAGREPPPPGARADARGGAAPPRRGSDEGAGGGPATPATTRAQRHRARSPSWRRGGCTPSPPCGCGRRRSASTSIGSSGSRRGSVTCASAASAPSRWRRGSPSCSGPSPPRPWPTPGRRSDRSLEEAVNLGLVATNPVDRVRPPKARAAAASAHRVRGSSARRGRRRRSARRRGRAAVRAGLAGVGGARPGLVGSRPRRRHRRRFPERACTPTASA